jgi:hypothetical protein
MDYPQYVVEEEVFQEDIDKGSLTASFINSTVTFLIAYLAVYLTFQFVTVLASSYFQIETNWYYFKLNFLAVTMSPLWHYLSVKTIFGIGPIVSLIMGFVYFFIYILKFKDRPGLLKLVFIWASLHSFNKFFGEFIGGVVASQFNDKFLGFLYVANYSFITAASDNWLAVSCLIVLITLGFFSTRYFLSTSYSRFFLFNNRMKLSFKLNTVFMPAVIGTLIIFFIKLPIMGTMDEVMEFLSYNVYELITYLTMIIMLIPVFNNYNTQLDLAIEIVVEDKKQRIEWKYLFILIVFYAVFRIILDPNLGMGLHIKAMEHGFDIDQFLQIKQKM